MMAEEAMTGYAKAVSLGTAFSVVSAVLVEAKFDSVSTALLVALGVETCALMLVGYVRIVELEKVIADSSQERRRRADEERSFLQDRLGEAVELLGLARSVEAKGDEILSKKLKFLMGELRALAQGRYELRRLEDVYLDDAESIGLLHRGEVLRSTCPVSRNDPVAQFKQRFYVMAMEAHTKAKRRGVDVERVYLFHDRTGYDIPDVQKHLSDLVMDGLDVRIILRDDPAFAKVEGLYSDFVVFGERKVSIGKIEGEDGTVTGASIYSDPLLVTKHISDFGVFLSISYPHPLRVASDSV